MQINQNVIFNKNIDSDICTRNGVSTSMVLPGVPGKLVHSASHYNTRLVYNSKVNPRDMEEWLANKGKKIKPVVD